MLCVDEKSQIQALDRTAPILPMLPGVPERATHDYRRAGTSSLCRAGPHHRQAHRPPAQPHRAIEFKQFLATIDREVPAELAVHIVRQQQHPQDASDPEVAARAPPLPAALHAHQLILAEPRRALVRRAHDQAAQARHPPLSRRPQQRHSRLDRDLERRSTPLHLDQDRRADPRLHPPLLRPNQRLTTLGAAAQHAGVAALQRQGSASKRSSSAWAYLREVPSLSRSRPSVIPPSASSSATLARGRAPSASAWMCTRARAGPRPRVAQCQRASSLASRPASSGGGGAGRAGSSSIASAAGESGPRRLRAVRGPAGARRAGLDLLLARAARGGRAGRARARGGAAPGRARPRRRPCPAARSCGSRTGRRRRDQRPLEPQLRMAPPGASRSPSSGEPRGRPRACRGGPARARPGTQRARPATSRSPRPAREVGASAVGLAATTTSPRATSVAIDPREVQRHPLAARSALAGLAVNLHPAHARARPRAAPPRRRVRALPDHSVPVTTVPMPRRTEAAVDVQPRPAAPARLTGRARGRPIELGAQLVQPGAAPRSPRTGVAARTDRPRAPRRPPPRARAARVHRVALRERDHARRHLEQLEHRQVLPGLRA